MALWCCGFNNAQHHLHSFDKNSWCPTLSWDASPMIRASWGFFLSHICLINVSFLWHVCHQQPCNEINAHWMTFKHLIRLLLNLLCCIITKKKCQYSSGTSSHVFCIFDGRAKNPLISVKILSSYDKCSLQCRDCTCIQPLLHRTWSHGSFFFKTVPTCCFAVANFVWIVQNETLSAPLPRSHTVWVCVRMCVCAWWERLLLLRQWRPVFTASLCSLVSGKPVRAEF